MKSIPSRRHLRRLLEGTGVALPVHPLFSHENWIWGLLALIHLAVFFGLWDLCLRAL